MHVRAYADLMKTSAASVFNPVSQNRQNQKGLYGSPLQFGARHCNFGRDRMESRSKNEMLLLDDFAAWCAIHISLLRQLRS